MAGTFVRVGCGATAKRLRAVASGLIEREHRQMEFRLLGPLEIHDDRGRVLELGGRQQKLVLAMLLLHRNEVVSVDRLIDALWAERPPSSAVKNVQVHISRVRKALEGASQEDILRTQATGYALEVAPGELDVNRFEQLLEDGRHALAADEPEEAEAALREALELWRGPPLADFTYESFAQGEIARLEELRLAVVEQRIEADLALGRHDDVTSELHRLVAEHPLRERPRAQLMLSLYRSGRKADALRVYEEGRRLLAEELGLEPSETTRRLQSALLADDPALAAPRRIPPRSPAQRAAPQSPLLARRSRALLGAGGALLLAAAVAVAALALTRDRTSAGIVSVGPNSLAAIDPDTNRLVAAIPVGTKPSSVVSAHGSLWVANLEDETVSRVDADAGRVVGTTPTGTAPAALAAGHGAIWTIGDDGIVLRIDPGFNKVGARIPTIRPGTLLTVAPATEGLAATADAVWSISGGYFAAPRVFRIDPAARRATPGVVTGIGPTAIAAGLGDVWVTDIFENSVSRIDAAGVVVATIPVGNGPRAIAVGEGAAWVADSLDDAVVRIDPVTNSPTTTIPVGRFPTAVAVGAGAVWVANSHDGTVSRIDPEKRAVVKTIRLGAAPAGLVVAGDRVWVTTQEAVPESRPVSQTGETVRLSSSAPFQTDPALGADPQINYATCAKLLNYPDAAAPDGTRLVPEVAAALPTLSPDGRTYTFTIRKGFAFSPPLRERVTAQTFKHAIERSLHPKMGPGAAAFAPDIVGLDPYRAGKAGDISGVVVKGERLSITLVRPDPTFTARIALPSFCAVPLNAPITPKGVPAIPSAGPYYITEDVPNRVIVLERNPNYRGSRPRRFREIRYTLGVGAAKSVGDVLAGRADYLVDKVPVKKDAELLARYGPTSLAAANGKQQYHVNPTMSLAFLELNTRRPLFSDARLRKAVNYAIDRRALAGIGNWVTGPFASIPTDQYLPPTMPGASPTVLYPPAGDLRAARRLAPNAHGTAVLYTCNDYPPLCRLPAEQIRSDLAALGLDVDIREFPFEELFERLGREGEPYDILINHWGADYVDPFNFLNLLLAGKVRPEYVRKLERVARLSGDARYRAYESLSVELARDEAPWVAYGTGASRDLFSARIGCQIFQPVSGIDLGALCLRR
jgi:YVTN family beta-propeller protein